ncbi:MAG: hypothetical protein HY426_04025 [Candidatus Levybacteria bacterium]|nr:hypothetical protein [Candidatus Levybacteria bacterium]
MSRASRKPVDKDLDQELQENFISLISSLNSSTNIEGFFNDFLTREEKIMLGKRLMLHLMLERGYKNSEIRSVLGISKETVRIHKLLWANGGAVYKEMIMLIVKKNKNKQFWKKIDGAIESMIKPVELIVKSRNDMRARAKLASGDWD